jgi:hypothetical protein
MVPQPLAKLLWSGAWASKTCPLATSRRLVCLCHLFALLDLCRGLLAALQLRHAYVSCQEVSRLRPLLSSVMAQLKCGKRRRDDGYEPRHKCDSLADLRLQLPGEDAARAAVAWTFHWQQAKGNHAPPPRRGPLQMWCSAAPACLCWTTPTVWQAMGCWQS